MTIHSVSVYTLITAGLGVRVPSAGIAAEFILGNQFDGPRGATITATGSMSVTASTVQYKGQGSVVSGLASITPAYPSGTAKGDLVLFVGGSKQYMNGFTNANFTRIGWSTDNFDYFKEDTPTHRAANNNVLGVDAGPTRIEHHFRVATAAHTGTETFTTGGTINHSAVGQFLRFAKGQGDEWVIKSYGNTIYSNGSSGPSSTFDEPAAGAATITGLIRGVSQYKPPTLSNIKGMAGNLGQCVLVSGNETWRSTTGHEWVKVAHPFAGEQVYKLRCENGVFIAIGNSGKIARSTDNGGSWTISNPIGVNPGWRGIKCYNGRWIVVGLGGYAVWSDDDGLTWTFVNIPTSAQLNDIAWGDGVTDARPEGWNNGKGMWFASTRNWDMYKSNDNGMTWSFWNYYDTNWAQSWFYTYDMNSMEYIGNDDFMAVGAVYGDRLEVGTSFWSTYTVGQIFGETDPQPFWQVRTTGYFGQFGFGAYQHGFDFNGGNSQRAIKWATLWDTAYFHRPGRKEYNVRWSSSLYNGPTGQYQQVEQANTYARLYDRPAKTFAFPSNGSWKNMTSYTQYGYGYMDGDQWLHMTGKNNGEITTENTGLWEYMDTVDERRPFSDSSLDIRDGDVVVISVSTTNTNDVLSNFSLYQGGLSGTYAIHPSTPGMTFTSWTELSVATSASGDKIKTYTGYVVAKGKLEPLFWEDLTQDPSNANHWRFQRTPYIMLQFDATNPTKNLGGRQAVVTVLHTQTFGVDVKITAKMTVNAEVKKTGILLGDPGSLYEASMVVDSYVEKSNTPTELSGFFNSNEVSGNSITVTAYYPVGGVPVGTLLVVWVSADNLSATTPTITISDTQGNTWNTVGFRGQNASAAGGIVTGIYYSIVTNPMPDGAGVITATLSGSVVCKLIHYRAFGGLSTTSVRNATLNSGTSATPTVTSGTVGAGDLVVANTGVENTTVPTNDSDTLNGPWVIDVRGTGAGGNALSHISQSMAYKIVTAAGAQTYNPATSPSTDWASVIGVFANPPTKYTAITMRATSTLTASIVVNKTLTTTGALSAAGNLTAAATVVEGAGLVSGTIIHAKTIDLADAVRHANATATLTAVALNPEPVGTLSTIHTTTAPLSVGTTMTATADVIHVLAATVSLTAVGSLIGYVGNIIPATVAMTAYTTIKPEGEYVKGAANPDHPDQDTPPIVSHPDPLPQTEGWHQFTSTYGPTGRVGNLLELTNRHYQEAYAATTTWPEFPFPNSPGGTYWFDWSTYAFGCRGSAVTPLGNDRFLVTWAQENWVQYQESWFIPGVPIERILKDVPMILVATVLDCSGGGDPVITGTSRYELPLQWRWYRSLYGCNAQAMGNGNVACVWTGFMNIQDNFAVNYGSITNLFHHSANIVCKVDASGSVPVFNWVKTFGGDWNGVETIVSKVMVHDGDVFVFRSGPDGSKVAKFTGGSGTYAGDTSSISINDDFSGLASCLVDGDQGILLYRTEDNSQLLARNVNLNSLTVGSEYEVRYGDGNIAIDSMLRVTKKGPDGKWYAAMAIPASSSYTVYKMNVVSGKVIVESIHMSDIPNLQVYTPSGLTRANAYLALDTVETWLSNLYPDETLYARHYKMGFCPGQQNPSVVGVAVSVATTQQFPEHTRGPQLVAQIPPIGSEGEPSRALAWVGSPAETNLTNWGHYFDWGYPQYVLDMDCAELSSGRVLIILNGVEDLEDQGYQDSGNGIFRIFAYIADPQNDPPPLKLAQRDDGKVVGGDRLGYDSENSGSIRTGRVAW